LNWKFHYLEEVDSTNIYAQSNLKAFNEDEITVIYTYNQTKGKGQIGKSWFSGINENLCFSLIFFPKDLFAADSFKLLMRISLALQQAIANLTGIQTKIKWPNDIYYEDQKLAGILIQNGIREKKMNYVIVGIGINVNTMNFPDDLPNPISLAQIKSHPFELEPLVMKLAMAMGETLFDKQSALISAYKNELYRRNQWANYKSTNGIPFQGKILGVTPDGCLQIEKRDSQIEVFNMHEIEFVF